MNESPEGGSVAAPLDESQCRQPGIVTRAPAPTWPRVAVVACVLVLAFFVAKNCQNDQIAVTQDEAIEIAMQQVDFEPTDTQIRLLRQGLDRRPFWVISLYIPLGGSPDPDFFKRLTLVRINAGSGEVESVQEQSPEESANQRRAFEAQQQKEP